MDVPRLNLINGEKIPIIGLGTFSVTDEKTLEESLDISLETGYRHIDTAYAYKNEHIIGRVLSKWFRTGKLKRDEIFITTKLPAQGVHPDRINEYLNQSLDDLQLDYVDLYLIHFPICMKPVDDPICAREPEPTDHIAVWKKLEEQVDLGRIKAIGLSNFNKTQIERVIKHSRIKPAALQIELHVYLQQRELVKFCQDNGIVVVSFFTLGNPGINEYYKKQGYPIVQEHEEILLLNPTVKMISEKYGKSPAQILLKFWTQKSVGVIPKSVTANRIKENIDLFDFILDDDDIIALQGLDRGENGRRAKCDFNEALFQPIKKKMKYTKMYTYSMLRLNVETNALENIFTLLLVLHVLKALEVA